MNRWLIGSLIGLCFVCISLADITNPSECDVWRSGTSHTIRWETDDLDDEVDIELYHKDILVLTIAEETDNDGSYDWDLPYLPIPGVVDDCDTYIFIHSSSGYDSTYIITGDDAVRSEDFRFENPIIYGSVNNEQPVTIADTFFKVRWSGASVPLYQVEYRENGNQDTAVKINHQSDRREEEDHEYVFVFDVKPDTEYQVRMRFSEDDDETEFNSEWTDYVDFKTYNILQCTDDFISVFFSNEVYDAIRTGISYPGFCGSTSDWTTTYAITTSSDFTAVYTDTGSGRIVVAHRGTESDNIEDAFDNLGILVSCDNVIPNIDDDDCSLSSGYAFNYEVSGSNIIIDLIKDGIAAGFTKLISTGHSQGGALATVGGADYASRFSGQIEISMISFGAPEVGNEEFAEYVRDQVDVVKRFVQYDEEGNPDVVVKLPSLLTGTTIIGDDARFFEQIPDVEVTLPCPDNLRCRTSGPDSFLPPFFCHCIPGYYDNLASSVQTITYNDNYQDLENVPSDWFNYEDAGSPEYSYSLSFFDDDSTSSNSPNSPDGISPISPNSPNSPDGIFNDDDDNSNSIMLLPGVIFVALFILF